MENAELYSAASGMQKKDAEEILTEFRDKLNWSRNVRILDVGCGSGEVTTEIILPQLPKGKEIIFHLRRRGFPYLKSTPGTDKKIRGFSF